MILWLAVPAPVTLAQAEVVAELNMEQIEGKDAVRCNTNMQGLI